MKKICKNCKWRDGYAAECMNETAFSGGVNGVSGCSGHSPYRPMVGDNFGCVHWESNSVDELVIMLNGKVEEFDRVTTNKRGVSTVEFKSGMSMTSSEFSIATNEKDVIAAIISNGWQNA